MAAKSIEIVEVAPRDGLQNEKRPFSTAQKLDLISRSISAGARRVEAVSFVNPKAVPQMADAEAVMQGLRDMPDLRERGVSIIGLALNERGFLRAIASDVDEINFVVVASESFNQRNQRAAIAETMQQIAECRPKAADAGIRFGVTIGAAFGCPFEGEVPHAQVFRLARELAEMNVEEIAIADTIGVGDPLAAHALVTGVREVAGTIPIRCHFHNTRNTGLANAFAAWQAGADVLDTSLGGLGGCPFAPAATGNIPTEDTVYMFERMGIETGYDPSALAEAASWLGRELGGDPLPGMLSKAGVFPPPVEKAA